MLLNSLLHFLLQYISKYHQMYSTLTLQEQTVLPMLCYILQVICYQNINSFQYYIMKFILQHATSLCYWIKKEYVPSSITLSIPLQYTRQDTTNATSIPNATSCQNHQIKSNSRYSNITDMCILYANSLFATVSQQILLLKEKSIHLMLQ